MSQLTLAPATIAAYRRDGFVHLPGIITKAEAAHFRAAALAASQRLTSNTAGSPGARVFQQLVNVWRTDGVMRELTLHGRVAAAAEQLAAVPLRLWHDQILIKEPHNQLATEFHQDQSYWPHRDSRQPLSAWIALGDVPVECGCMTFIPGSQHQTELPSLDLMDGQSLFRACPELRWSPRVTIPLRAGDCTFHHGRCAHMATPNCTYEPRVAHVVIYMDATTRYQKRRDGQAHPVTDPLGLAEGDLLAGDCFPRVGGAA